MSGTESSGGEGAPARDFAFALELNDVVFAKRLKPTTEITKKSNTSRERHILRIKLYFPGLIRFTF